MYKTIPRACAIMASLGIVKQTSSNLLIKTDIGRKNCELKRSQIMSAAGAIGQDPIADQPAPTRSVPLYNIEQMEHWPPPLREAYDTWFDFVAEFTQYRRALQAEDRDRNGAEISYLSRFIAFAVAPLQDGYDLRFVEPVDGDITFQFAAIGPYGDVMLLIELYEDCLTHDAVRRDFHDIVRPYMQFLARYDPGYWVEEEHCDPLDCIYELLADDAAAGRYSDQCHDVVRNLQTEEQDLLDVEYDEGALDDEEEARREVVEDLLRDSQRQWREAHENRLRINGQLQVQNLINDWLRTNRPPRGQNSHLQTNGGAIRFPPLREPHS